jgi:hypothetical protein
VVEWSVILSNGLRWVHGGSYEPGVESDSLEAYSVAAAGANLELPFYGFRVAGLAVPEPSSALLAALAFVLGADCRRRS